MTDNIVVVRAHYLWVTHVFIMLGYVNSVAVHTYVY